MKILYFSNFIIISFIFSNFMFSLNRKHMLVILLSLELIVLNLFFLVYLYLTLNMMNSIYLMLVFMILFVCEGVLGLSILVSMIRLHGNDYMNSYNVI
uniref:NADH dehydrogenase subunit 4L n=1 Tax=Uenoa lobata TaxID=1958741 RepID=UPI0022DCDB04|nr:NADH dehydrogenase subunit 4L [Uenoa lobata]UZZ44451.1 NADH dehydrogenase subunit 4L [Uenoa lobata]